MQAPVTWVLGPEYRRSRSRIELDITWACNLTCPNCNRSCPQAPTTDRMRVEQVRQFVKESRVAGQRWERIRLLGGEPTLHPEFADIIAVLIAYKREFSPETVLEISTNGYGSAVAARIAALPPEVSVNNSHKEPGVQPEFAAFNIAPQDLPAYRGVSWKNGCSIITSCGFGLTPKGYYPCAIAGGIDRIFGGDRGRTSLPSQDDDMVDLLEEFCPKCGHFQRGAHEPLLGPVASATWTAAYAAYERPKAVRVAATKGPKK